MSHPATFTHPSDPPRTHLTANPIKWLPEHDDMLKALVEEKRHSYAQIAARLNAAFGTNYSRNSAIGRANRLELNNTRPDQNVRPVSRQRPKLRIVRANGNTTNLKLAYSVERGLETFQAPLEAPNPLNLTLHELVATSCRYLTQDGPDWRFCGHDRQLGYSYCPAHKPLVWIPATDRNARARGVR